MSYSMLLNTDGSTGWFNRRPQDAW